MSLPTESVNAAQSTSADNSSDVSGQPSADDSQQRDECHKSGSVRDDHATNSADMANQDSCETVTLTSSSSRTCLQPAGANDDDNDSAKSTSPPGSSMDSDSDSLSCENIVEDVSFPDQDREDNVESKDVRNYESNQSQTIPRKEESQDSFPVEASPGLYATASNSVTVQEMLSPSSSALRSPAIQTPTHSVQSVSGAEHLHSCSAPSSNGPRPDSLYLTGSTASAAGGAVAAGGHTRKHRTIAKKESYSSLSEYSSRSSSIDQLIEAATSTPLHTQGTVDVEGDMITFVADGLNELIKRSRDSSAVASCNSSISRSSSSLSSSTTSGWSAMSTSVYSRATRSPSVLTGSPDEIPPIDPKVVLDLEAHAHRVAASLDSMMKSLTTKLHNMSSCTNQCVDVYKEAVDSTCDSVDASIKSMYALMAKCEEMSQAIKPVYQVHEQVKEIKRLLDLFEAQLTYDET